MIIICGPTASGKTCLAHYIAKNMNGEIICADSRQLYSDLSIITASPNIILKREIPYLLYNFLPITEKFSAPKYANLAANKIKHVISKGKTPIIVGGSGMYINSLIYGYNEIPNINKEIFDDTINLMKKIGNIEFFNQLIKIDPLCKNKLHPQDTQRLIRAYCVFIQTGISIFTLQHDTNKIIPLKGMKFKLIFLNPTRSLLYANCNNRLLEMIENGAVKEVKKLYDIYNNQLHNVCDMIGVKEIIHYIEGQISIEKTIELIQARTRQYAKRQVTWFKHQLQDEKIILNYDNIIELQNMCNDHILL